MVSEVIGAGIDWGSSNARAWSFGPFGKTIESNRLEIGLKNARAHGFAECVSRLIAPLSLPRCSIRLACGMIGGRGGTLFNGLRTHGTSRDRPARRDLHDYGIVSRHTAACGMNPMTALPGRPVLAILRRGHPDEVPAISEKPTALDIRRTEVPLISPDAFTSIELLRSKINAEALIDAGSFLATQEVGRLPGFAPRHRYRCKRRDQCQQSGLMNAGRCRCGWHQKRAF